MKITNQTVKKAYLPLIALALMLFSAQSFAQETVSYTDSWSKAGMTLVDETRGGVKVIHSVEEFLFLPVDVKGESMNKIAIAGSILPGEEGKPDLPSTGRYIAIPQGAKATVNILSYRKETFQNVEIAPAPRIPLETDKNPLYYEKNATVYGKDAFYPENPVTISKETGIRGVDAVILGVSPFQYNPVTKELIVYHDLEIEVTFEGGTGVFGEERLRSRYWDPILEDAMLNYQSLPAVDYDARLREASSRSTDGCEYLIITPTGPDYLAWADSIKKFRMEQGIITEVVTVDEAGGNTVPSLEIYFNNAYNTWTMPPAAVLILGDYGSDATKNITSPIYDNYCVSDNIWADVDGNHLPEMTFARITANNADQLETMVTKFLNHERNPPTNPDFYNNPITACGWQTERWFQICSETVGGYFKNVHGKDPVRINEIYSGTPGSTWSTNGNTSTVVNYFGPNGLGYIPASPNTLGGWSGGNATDINNAINSGAFILQHRDHGMETGWGEPAYTNSNINGCQNTDLTFVFSINCLTGKYNYNSEVFTEKFHRYTYNGQNSGALGLNAASEVSYSFVNDTYVWGMYDNMWPDFMPDYGSTPEERGLYPSFGSAAGKYFLQQSSWPSNTNNKEVTYHLFHHHGGAFLTLYSEVPQNYNLNHAGVMLGGLDYFTVQCDSGAFMAFTENGEIIGTAVATGQVQDVTIVPQTPGDQIKLVITKTNFVRHEEMLTVISPDGPYCIYNTYTVNDDMGGNGNNSPEYGENVFLNVHIENLGNGDAENAEVSISMDPDQYITLIDGFEDYGTIPANSITGKEDAFELNISANVPDLHEIPFEITVKDINDSIWSSTMYVSFYAPVLFIESLTIDDNANGNGNGRLDPGEEATIKIKNRNTGHCIAENTYGEIEILGPFVEAINTVDTIGTLGMFGPSYTTFDVVVDDEAPDGCVIFDLVYTLTSGQFVENETYKLKIGLLYDDFETGNFNKFPWQHDGNLPWETNMQYPYQGNFDIISGQIGNAQSSELTLQFNVMTADSITFIKKVSSATGDKLKFYQNNTLIADWSGTGEGWTREAFYVTPGNYTFKWIYQKDGSGTSGADKAWVDYITFPPMQALICWAGADDKVCTGEDYQLNGSAQNYDAVEWTTAGTGTFNDPTILNPIYTPSAEDITNGSVVLTLAATSTSGGSVDDIMNLSFKEAPVTPATPEGPDYIDVIYTTTSMYTTTGAAEATTYVWAIEPAEAGTISGEGTDATVEWNADYIGLATITVKGVNECGEGEFSEGFEVTVDNTTGIEGAIEDLKIRVYPNPSNGYFKFNLNGSQQYGLNIRIVNTVGVDVFNENIQFNGQYTKEVDLSKLAEGMYFLIIEGEGIYMNDKIVILH